MCSIGAPPTPQCTGPRPAYRLGGETQPGPGLADRSVLRPALRSTAGPRIARTPSLLPRSPHRPLPIPGRQPPRAAGWSGRKAPRGAVRRQERWRLGGGDEGCVPAASGDELVVRARLDEPAVVEHRDRVGVADGGEPVGDRDRRAPAGQLVERPLEGALGGGVERRGRLVEHEHGRVAQDGAGHGQPLLLTTREPVAASTHDRLEPVGQRGDQVGHLSRGQRRPQLALGGGGPREQQVVAHRGVHEVALLRHDTHDRGEHVGVQVAHVDAVDRHPPGCRGRAAARAALPRSTCPSRSVRRAPASTPPAPTG